METLITILITILGAVMGSFLGCMGYRIPNKIKTTKPSSFCTECGKPLKWYMNIPIFSYLFLRGKCAYCKKPINSIYFFIEVACALLFMCNYMLYGFTINFFLTTILSCALIVTIVSDCLYYYISDRVIILSIIGLIVTFFCFLETREVFGHIIAGASIFVIMLAIKYLGNIMFKKESLGDGDIKLMGVVGIACGIFNSLITLFLASILGLIFSVFSNKNKEGIIPFGPFLLVGSLLTFYFSGYISQIFGFLGF